MGVIVISGSGSGIGAASRARCESDGHQVIGIDLQGAEIIADLATKGGRDRAIKMALQESNNRLNGVVVCAGVGPEFDPQPTIVSLNYFGAQQLLEGFRSALAAAGTAGVAAAVAVSSNSAPMPGNDTAMVAACLDGNEDEARRLSTQIIGPQVYGGSKLALARWVRRNAPTADWAGSGIRLNAVAPGAVVTPLLQRGLDHPIFGPAIRNFPIPTGAPARAEQIADAIAFLLSPQAAFCCGSVLFADGGTDALLRPDQF